MNDFIAITPATPAQILPRGIRESTDSDLPAMMEIFNETAGTGSNSPVTRALTLEEVAFQINLYKCDKMPVYVLERDGEVLGWLSINRFCWGSQACHTTGEMGIYVRADHCGTGMGVRLARTAVILGRQYGLETIVGWIMAANLPSQRMAQAIGARLWARMPNIARFGQKRADVLMFGLPLYEELPTEPGDEAASAANGMQTS
ncbi:L-amino acid N-acyltransferase YncA [Pseudomonas sp. F-14 TE3623]|uniref:GNAT family N-acetyltransferase n=1 Tax=Pseudomonas farris TaxID=2841207 RepID=A0ABS6PWT2_9PSED|nr:GNAT family N-acetyltransferase [Pseudomonas farris]MBV4464925.1 GNAT family N-acetyltransferase [Pseudomonas farris]